MFSPDLSRALTWFKDLVRNVPNYVIIELHRVRFLVAIHIHDFLKVGNTGREIVPPLRQISLVSA